MRHHDRETLFPEICIQRLFGAATLVVQFWLRRQGEVMVKELPDEDKQQSPLQVSEDQVKLAFWLFPTEIQGSSYICVWFAGSSVKFSADPPWIWEQSVPTPVLALLQRELPHWVVSFTNLNHSPCTQS